MTDPSFQNIYAFEATRIDGKRISLSEYEGKVLLIVNVASQCGYTPQYEGLEKLYEKHRSSGFEVLGFPCNQFGGQEPGKDPEIREFCETRFGVRFPLFSKIEVNGPHADPLYRFLTESRPGILGTQAIKWNFTKFLIDRKGNPVKRFAPGDRPEAIENDIKKLLEIQSTGSGA